MIQQTFGVVDKSWKIVRYRRENLIKPRGQLNKVARCKTRKCLTNKETDDEVNEKAYLKQSSLKQKIMSGQA